MTNANYFQNGGNILKNTDYKYKSFDKKKDQSSLKIYFFT